MKEFLRKVGSEVQNAISFLQNCPFWVVEDVWRYTELKKKLQNIFEKVVEKGLELHAGEENKTYETILGRKFSRASDTFTSD